MGGVVPWLIVSMCGAALLVAGLVQFLTHKPNYRECAAKLNRAEKLWGGRHNLQGSAREAWEANACELLAQVAIALRYPRKIGMDFPTLLAELRAELEKQTRQQASPAE